MCNRCKLINTLAIIMLPTGFDQTLCANMYKGSISCLRFIPWGKLLAVCSQQVYNSKSFLQRVYCFYNAPIGFPACILNELLDPITHSLSKGWSGWKSTNKLECFASIKIVFNLAIEKIINIRCSGKFFIFIIFCNCIKL